MFSLSSNSKTYPGASKLNLTQLSHLSVFASQSSPPILFLFLRYNKEGDLLFSCGKDHTPTVWFADNVVVAD
ncbi:hypothetical protein GBA52_011328 [Prunus armeniaca]|nr:hypothetical protein GBA52_011328 [Prunus armeniaca]